MLGARQSSRGDLFGSTGREKFAAYFGDVMNPPVGQATPSETRGVQAAPLLRMLLLALILPVALAFLADWALGTSPIIVIAVSVLCIPLASLLIINRALRDMNALIAAVAPPDVIEDAPEHADALQAEAEAQLETDALAVGTVLDTVNEDQTKAVSKENSHIGGSDALPMD